ncbi:hypothetical protein HPP92_012783 [Vanilla planifolia]|uniref:Uncharacterized protein n=1 Tax=Vanilla planifolia TaxID=51239 RepID=A0A835UVV4_VANPL|nr:hypothetical protein HPP92_012783 [Vanilla planifolia]
MELSKQLLFLVATIGFFFLSTAIAEAWFIHDEVCISVSLATTLAPPLPASLSQLEDCTSSRRRKQLSNIDRWQRLHITSLSSDLTSADVQRRAHRRLHPSVGKVEAPRIFLFFFLLLMARQSSPEIDDELFNEVYGKEYTGPLGSTHNNVDAKANANKRPSANDQSDEEDQIRDPNAVPTDFTSRKLSFGKQKLRLLRGTGRREKKKK